MSIDIEKNYEEYKKRLREVQREGLDELLKWLDGTDFKTSPASTKYHNNIKGGLVSHSLNVLNKALEDLNFYEKAQSELPAGERKEIQRESVIIVALLHDLGKVNGYENGSRNVKVNGKWESRPEWKIKQDAYEYTYGGHEVASMCLARKYVKLKSEEFAAIANHQGFDGSYADRARRETYRKVPLCALIHNADMYATYLLEKVDSEA